jgi:hypothetical protein
MRWERLVARKVELRNACSFLVQNVVGIDHLGDLVVDVRIILKLICDIMNCLATR